MSLARPTGTTGPQAPRSISATSGQGGAIVLPFPSVPPAADTILSQARDLLTLLDAGATEHLFTFGLDGSAKISEFYGNLEEAGPLIPSKQGQDHNVFVSLNATDAQGVVTRARGFCCEAVDKAGAVDILGKLKAAGIIPKTIIDNGYDGFNVVVLASDVPLDQYMARHRQLNEKLGAAGFGFETMRPMVLLPSTLNIKKSGTKELVTMTVLPGAPIYQMHELIAKLQLSAEAPKNMRVEAIFEPSTRPACRDLLDAAVADDPRAFVLGNPTGLLVFLRVPDKDKLLEGTHWDSDLPGTSIGQTADVVKCAETIAWKQRAGGKTQRLYRTHPPRDFCSDYLITQRGQYKARILRGIARVPRIDNDGTIHFVSGYDAETGLFHDKPISFDVPENPTRDDALERIKTLTFPFSEYRYEDQAAGEAVMLAAIFTAIERPFMALAPMFIIRSAMAGVGKGKIGRALTLLGFGTRPIFVNWGKNEEEAEKRLVGILLQSPAQFTIDNANDAKVKGELLCTLITEGYAELRPLGSSVMAKTDCRPFTLLTGTHPTVTGDMARRALNIDVEARSAAPDRDAYPFDPIEEVHTNRVALLQAAFTAMRAFRRAGMPAQGLAAIEAFDSARGGAVGSFDDWARKVRDLVYWLTGHDVSEGFQQNKKEDPDRRNDEALVAALHGVFGDSTFRSADAIAVHVKVSNNNPCGPEEQLLFNAIEEIFDKRSASSKSLGVWAHRQDKVHTKDFILKLGRDDISNTNTITVRKI